MWTLIVIALAALLGLLRVTLGADPGDSSTFFRQGLDNAALALSVLAVALILRQVLGRLIARYAEGKSGVASDLLRSVLTISLYLAAGMVLLHWILGVDLGSVLATSAILSAIIGLALQPILGQFFAGVSIELERPLRVGDYVRRDQLEGEVVSLNWRSVYLRTERGSTLLMPNSEFTGRLLEVVPGDRPYRHELPFFIASTASPGRVIRVATQVLKSGLHGVCHEPPPTIILVGNEAVSGTLRYTARFYTDLFLERGSIASRFLERLWYALSREGLSLPAPPALLWPADDAHGVEGYRPIAGLPGSPNGPEVKAWPGLEGLSPGLVHQLTRHGRVVEYGYGERCPARTPSLILRGRLRIHRPIDPVRLQPELSALLAALESPESPSPGECQLSQADFDRLQREATLVLGPLAFGLCERIAALTDDPWLAYRAAAQSIPGESQREHFLARAPAHSHTSLHEGDWFGWAHALGQGEESSECLASQDTALLVWSGQALTGLLAGLGESEREELADRLRQRGVGCSELSAERLRT